MLENPSVQDYQEFVDYILSLQESVWLLGGDYGKGYTPAAKQVLESLKEALVEESVGV